VIDPIRWGIIATGNIAHKLAHDIKSMPDAQLMAVGSRSQESADAFAQEFGIPHAHGTYEGVANDPDVDVVYIATPNDLHAENVRACIEAGKAVLCEKPFTLNAAQAKPLIELARSKGVFLMEAMWSRFIPTHRKLYDMVRTGALGDIRMVQADFGFKAEYDPENRLFNPARGGGALLDLGVYPIALTVRLLGAPDTISGHVTLAASGVDEQSAVVFGYASGAFAVLTSSAGVQTFNEARVFGTKGRARLEEPFWKADQLSTYIEHQEQHYVLPREDWGYQYQLEEVHRCMRAGEIESPGMPHADTLTILTIMDTLRAQWGVKFPGE
jgi:predicted dehydrogenase